MTVRGCMLSMYIAVECGFCPVIDIAGDGWIQGRKKDCDANLEISLLTRHCNSREGNIFIKYDLKNIYWKIDYDGSIRLFPSRISNMCSAERVC